MKMYMDPVMDVTKFEVMDTITTGNEFESGSTYEEEM